MSDYLRASWKSALKDAEDKLRQANVEVLKWKAVVQTCRERVERNAPWPGDQVQDTEVVKTVAECEFPRTIRYNP